MIRRRLFERCGLICSGVDNDYMQRAAIWRETSRNRPAQLSITSRATLLAQRKARLRVPISMLGPEKEDYYTKA